MGQFQGIEGRPPEVLADEVRRGGKFVFYQYCFSVLIMTFKRPSPVYYVPPGQSLVTPGLVWSAISLFVGWWGLPWGFIWTPTVIFKNFMGGTDVTAEALEDLGIDLSAPAAMAPPATGYIQFLAGPLTGQAFTVPPEGMYLGQAPGPGALAVPDPLVAPQHCWIGPDPSGAVVLVDVGSQTGTFVVNAASSTQVQQVALQPGDQVYLGGQGGPVFQFGR